ncbi:hypothetical protein D3C75_863370 [compost metagenome]
MGREKSFLDMLEATAVMQQQIAIILESKALESEKARNWVCAYLRDEAFPEYPNQFKQSLEIHKNIVELIDSMTKMQTSLGSNLKAVLNKNESSGGGSLFGGFGGFGGDDGDDS